MERKLIKIDLDTYNRIRQLAHDNGRTIGGQVRWMTLATRATDYRVVSISELPGEPGCDPVAVVDIAPIE